MPPQQVYLTKHDPSRSKAQSILPETNIMASQPTPPQK